MFILILSSLIAILLLLLYNKWTKVRSFWAEKGVQHSPPHPLLGSLTFLMRESTTKWFQAQYEKFNTEPYFGIWLFWRPALAIRSPELARNILVQDFDSFRDRHLGSGKRDPIGHSNIFSVNDPVWSSIRKHLTPMFTSSKLKSFQHIKLGKAKELVQRIKMEMENKKRIDLREIFADYTTDIIGASAFGVAGDATLTGESPIRAVTKEFGAYDWWRGLSFTSIFFFPEITDFFGFSFFPKKSTDFLRKIFNKVVEQRGGWKKQINETKDLMDLLINLKQEAVSKNMEEITDDLLMAQATIMLQGGFDTTAVALTFTMCELAHHPHIQNKLYHEIKEAKEKLGERDFDFSTLADLTYLNCVVKESLRKYPAMGWISRIATKDYVVDDKLTIKKGTPVYVVANGMHYDPEYFPDPHKYEPERFLPENEANIKPFTYMPFGEGPRFCIGLRFGRQTMAHALAHILLEFEVRPLPDMPKPRDMKFEKKSMFLTPDRPLSVEFVPRK